ncbi:MAG: hypothetical protein KKA54_11050 [Proteobacteria bacterium]|nr:hypothetical protein [Pseudomonadota bacterium]MBU0966901.1 hypothetical protein [Pseudomonadota bacterium]
MAARNKERDELAAGFDSIFDAAPTPSSLSLEKAQKLLAEIDSLPDDSVKSNICINRFGLTLFEVQAIAHGDNESSSSEDFTHAPPNGVTGTPLNGETIEYDPDPAVTQPAKPIVTQPTDATVIQNKGVTATQYPGTTYTPITGVPATPQYGATGAQIHLSFNTLGTLLRSENQIKVFVFLYDRLHTIPQGMILLISATEIASILDLSLHTARKIIPSLIDKNLISVTPLTREEKKVKQGYKMNATSLGMALYSELKREINYGATVTPLSGITVAPPSGVPPKKATVTPLYPLPVAPSNGAPISCSGFFNNTPQPDATPPSLPLDDLLERLDLTEWEKLDSGMLVAYIQKGREWIQDILDGTAAAIEYKKRLAAENPEKQYNLITMPFRFLKSNLANGYVDTPPGWKTRKQKAMETELARVQKDVELAFQLQAARKKREEGILMLQIEEMLANPSGDLFKKIKNLIPEKELQNMQNLNIAEGHPAFNKLMERYFKVHLGIAEE